MKEVDMRPVVKQRIVFSIIAALVLVPFASVDAVSQDPFVDDQPDSVKMAVDILVARPLGLASTVLGSVVYIVALPFSALGGDTRTPWEKLVVDPARFTFKRPVGKF